MTGLAELLEHNAILREQLKERESLFQKQLDERDELLDEKDKKIAVLEAQLTSLVEWRERLEAAQQRPKNERFVASLNQEQLPFDVKVTAPELIKEEPESTEEPKPTKNTKNHKKKKPKRRKLSDNKKLKHHKVHCDADDMTCPNCKGDMRVFGSSTSYRAEWIPGSFIIEEVVRDRCRCEHCSSGSTFIAPEPYVLPKALCGNGLLVYVLMYKFGYHMPLNRLSTLMKRKGLDFSTSTLSGWVAKSADILVRVSDAIHDELMLCPWIQGDDTGHPVQDGSDGKLRKGRLWAFTDQTQVWYGFTPTKEGIYPAQLLSEFQGEILLADAGSEFNQVVRDLGLQRAGCWSHVRHYFIKAQTHYPKEAKIALTVIQKLFMIERELKELSPEERLAQRRRQSEPLIDELMKWIKGISTTARPDSQLAKSCGYLINQEKALRLFLAYPELPIHNNLSELMLRHNVVGRKNWLFSGSQGGAEAATVMFTLINSCSLLDIDPEVYLLDVLKEIQSHPVNRIGELTPKRWLAEKNRPDPSA